MIHPETRGLRGGGYIGSTVAKRGKQTNDEMTTTAAASANTKRPGPGCLLVCCVGEGQTPLLSGVPTSTGRGNGRHPPNTVLLARTAMITTHS